MRAQVKRQHQNLAVERAQALAAASQKQLSPQYLDLPAPELASVLRHVDHHINDCERACRSFMLFPFFQSVWPQHDPHRLSILFLDRVREYLDSDEKYLSYRCLSLFL